MSDTEDSSSGRDLRGKFRPGFSGNAGGRKAGTPDKRSHHRRKLEQKGDKYIAKLDALVEAGDKEALLFALARLIPPARDRDAEETASLPIAEGASLGERIKAVSHAALTGSLSPTVAQQLARVLAAEASVTEIADLADRLAKLEGQKA